MNKSVMKCCICNNENIGEFITINDKKYHLFCIEQLEQENKELKEDIKFCLHSIKQEMEMSTDSRTRKEMRTCYGILNRWNK